MKTASTIRSCAKILLVLLILGVFGFGLIIANAADPDIAFIVALAVWIGGGYGSYFEYILILGFADIIDNTYEMAQRTNSLSSKLNNNSSQET